MSSGESSDNNLVTVSKKLQRKRKRQKKQVKVSIIKPSKLLFLEKVDDNNRLRKLEFNFLQ